MFLSHSITYVYVKYRCLLQHLNKTVNLYIILALKVILLDRLQGIICSGIQEPNFTQKRRQAMNLFNDLSTKLIDK